MDSFFDQSEVKQEVVTNQKKKRKLDDKKDDNDELKQKARLYCSCTEQWKIVNKYSVDKLKTWVDEKEFEPDENDYMKLCLILCNGPLHLGWIQSRSVTTM